MKSIFFIFLSFILFVSVATAQNLVPKIQNIWWKMEKGKTSNCFLPNGKAETREPDSKSEAWKDLGNNKIEFKGITYEIVSVTDAKLVMKMSGINFNFIAQGKYEQVKVTTPSKKPGISYKKDDKVTILWKEKWYPGKIIEVLGNNTFKVSYDGFDAEWDEEVGLDRIKKL
jgi:hypothetical protein